MNIIYPCKLKMFCFALYRCKHSFTCYWNNSTDLARDSIATGWIVYWTSDAMWGFLRHSLATPFSKSHLHSLSRYLSPTNVNHALATWKLHVKGVLVEAIVRVLAHHNFISFSLQFPYLPLESSSLVKHCTHLASFYCIQFYQPIGCNTWTMEFPIFLNLDANQNNR